MHLSWFTECLSSLLLDSNIIEPFVDLFLESSGCLLLQLLCQVFDIDASFRELGLHDSHRGILNLVLEVVYIDAVLRELFLGGFHGLLAHLGFQVFFVETVLGKNTDCLRMDTFVEVVDIDAVFG